MKEVKKLPIVCNFQHSQYWPSFQKSVWHVATDLSTVLKKRQSLFPRFPKNVLLTLQLVLLFSYFFFRTPYFTAASLIKRSFLMPFRLLFFTFWLPLGKVASFLLQWMRQQKYSKERTNNWGGFCKYYFGKKFEKGEVLAGIRL